MNRNDAYKITDPQDLDPERSYAVYLTQGNKIGQFAVLSGSSCRALLSSSPTPQKFRFKVCN